MGAIPKQDEVENIARIARMNLANDGYLAQVGFIWTGDKVAIVGGRAMRNQTDKMAWAAILRRMVIELKADALLTVVEVWAKNTTGASNIPLYDQMGPVSGMDGAYEAVMLNLETMDGTWNCLCPIVRSEGQPPSFPMPRFWSQGPTAGILTNLIPDKKASAYGRRES